ncbi:hypothetical protein D3C80_2055860 [compost metagenome]
MQDIAKAGQAGRVTAVDGKDRGAEGHCFHVGKKRIKIVNIANVAAPGHSVQWSYH